MTTIALLPYFLQYPVGLLADKICGEKEFLLTGFLILIITAISIFWLNSASFWVWLLVLFIARIGASLINIMSDTYFYKKVNVKDISLIDFYHSAGPVGYLIGPLAASILLIFIDLKLLFLMAGIIMVLGLVGALKLQDTK
jgi:MFS family permease